MDLEFEKHCSVRADGEAIDDVITAFISQRSKELHNDDAFYVMDVGYVVRMLDQWKRLLPRVRPFYAVKANNDPVLLQTMAQMNLGFDCASKGEIEMVSNLGVLPSKIIYANPHKQLSHLKYASSKSIDLTVFDGEEELYKIKEHAPHMRLLLRMNTSGFGTGYFDDMHEKFGCPLEKSTSLLQVAKKLELHVHGVCFHVGVAVASEEAYVSAIKASRIIFDHGKEMGFQMKLLDIGGGFSCKTTNNYCKRDFTEMASKILETLDEDFPVDCGVDIIAEPGTYFTMPSTQLVVNIIGKRCTPDKPDVDSKPSPNDGSPDFVLFINDSLYSSLLLFGSDPDYVDLVIKPVSKTRRCEPHRKCKIWGQSLAIDLVTKECKLPEMMVGEWLYITDLGTYSSAMGTTFNGFQPRPVQRFITQTDKKRLVEIISEVDDHREVVSTGLINSNGKINLNKGLKK